jgi:hypothetical protein
MNLPLPPPLILLPYIAPPPSSMDLVVVDACAVELKQDYL